MLFRSSAMNGYQYRAVFTGSCTATDFSSAATLTVNPLTAQVSPTSATICNGSSQQLQIQNSASASVTNTVSSGTISLTIPDADPAGVISSPVTIAGIPANAVVTDISVNFNINHTWVGDIDINLIAPNGQNLNLVGSLNNGAGSNGTDNFTNTTISSTSTTAISGAPAPRTGTFAAEKRAGYGPTGNAQTATDSLQQIAQQYLPVTEKPSAGYQPQVGEKVRLPRFGQVADVLAIRAGHDEVTVR